MKFIKSIFFIFIFLPVLSYAQSGPGGVGNSTNNVLWLRADSGTSTTINGQAINTWNDLSGNGNHVSQSTVAQQPLFQSNVLNGKPAVAFDFNNTAGQNDFLSGADSPTLDNTSGLTIFAVIRPTSGGSARSIIAKRVNVGVDQSYMLFFFTADQLFADIVSNNDRFSTPISYNQNNNYIITMHYDGTLASTNRAKVFTNEVLTHTATESSASIPDYNSPLVIGATHIGDNRAFGGNMGEIIVYRTALNTTQRILVNNYLSAKYNIPLGTNDIYTMDNTLNGDFDHEMAGIGRVSVTDNHINAQGSGIVNILNARNLNNNEFLLWGHNNLTQQAWDSTDVPASIDARFERVWRVSEVNSSNTPIDVGNVDIRWDLSSYSPVTASDLRLLVDTDNDGAFADETPIGGATIISSGIYQFSNVAAITNGRKFTLGTLNAVQTPLPIVLTSFELTQLNLNKVKLDWTTSSEINNDFFEVQRSLNLQHWEVISTVKGAGNSSSHLTYSITDHQPYFNTQYYRLKQVDFNGEYEYSMIKSITLDQFTNSNNIEIYPNPTNNLLHVEFKDGFKTHSIENIHIYDLIGNEATSKVSVIKKNDDQLEINVSSLSPGGYLLRTVNNSHIFLKK